MKNKQNKLPFLAQLLLKIITFRDEDFFLLREFDEEFNDIFNFQGIKKARMWYWLQLLKSGPSILITSLSWKISMLTYYIKISFRNLKRNRIYSLINLDFNCSYLFCIASECQS